jgi:H+-transporting ATPase
MAMTAIDPEQAREDIAGGARQASQDGLSSAEALRLLDRFGPNAVPDVADHPLQMVLAKFWAPVPWMLEAAILLQLVLGEYYEALAIAVLLSFNAVLGFIQESRAQATLDALKSRLALMASVRRDRAWKIIPAAGLVRGDIVKLSLGTVVPADVRLLDGSVLLDQSMLTGESLPIEGGTGRESYAGALVRRGEAVAEVTATGPRTKFGRTAELIRTAHVVSSQQKAVLRVVRNLAIFNGIVVVVQVTYALTLRMPFTELILLALTSVLAAIPVALPATFTLAAALGARALARTGVLPTRLSAVDEAASMDVLCADKTGTLTRNELKVSQIQPMPGFDPPHVLALAALASSDGGQDPVDGAIRAAAVSPVTGLPKLLTFTPFDPAVKMSEASAIDAAGLPVRIVKGAYAAVAVLAQPAPAAANSAGELTAQGYRVLAVAVGPPENFRLAGLIALGDELRADSAALIVELTSIGVHTVMVTGDAPATAATVGKAVGISGAVCPPGHIPESVRPDIYAIFAGVLPEDKFRIVQAFQKGGHVVGMCGDGANDAPALRQAQMGIAVSTATDVAKSAAGIVLTESGLGGIVAAVKEGRVTFQRILTYTLRSISRKIDQMMFLTVGLIMTGHAILTPLLIVILMVTGDFLAMSSTTDNVHPSPRPNTWRIDRLTIAGIIFGTCNLIFCSGILAIGKFELGFDIDALRTLAAVILVFSGQAVFYVVRERRRMWSSRPSAWMIVSSVADVSIIAMLAARGILMTPLPAGLILSLAGAAAVFSFVLDTIKAVVFRRFQMT